MPVGSLLRILAAGLFVAALPGLSAAQVLYTEDFDDGTAASRWTTSQTGGTNVADFAYELAGEWAAFPAPYGANKGFSRYRNIAGNRHQIGLSAYLAFLTGLRTGIQSGTVMSSGEHVQPDVASAGAVGVVRDSPDDAMVQRSVPAGPSSAPLQVVEIEDAGRLQILTFAKD
jgi:hypothetical protein